MFESLMDEADPELTHPELAHPELTHAPESSATPELTYAPRDESHPIHHRTGKIATILGFAMLVGVASLWMPRWMTFAKAVYLERDCLSYRMRGEPICTVNSASAAPQRTAPPESWARFYNLLSGAGFKSDGTVFLHERFTPSGQSRLIAVDAVFKNPSADDKAISFQCHSISRSQGLSMPRELSSTYFGGDNGPGFIHWTDSVKLFPGKTDAANPSHFTIDAEIDGRRTIIDGWITDRDDNVVLQQREDLFIAPLQPRWATQE